MFNSADIYLHLLKGGNKQDLYVSLEKEIAEAEAKVKARKEAEQKEKELANKINKARSAASKALKDYFALVNPNVTEEIIASVLDTLETVEIKINGVRGKGKDAAVRDGRVLFTDEEVEKIWNTLFSFNSKRK